MSRWKVLQAIGASIATTILFSSSLLVAQVPGPPAAGGTSGFLNSLSTYADHATNPEGELRFATELIQMVTSHISQSDAAQLARRLASADQAARQRSLGYVSETAVAASFNQLMAKVQDGHARPLHTDAQTVHRMRLVLAGNSPALTSVKKRPTSCLPSEAILLTALLKYNSGKVVFVPHGQASPPLGESMRAENSTEDAASRLDQYLAAHSTTTNMALFNGLLQSMGM